MEIRGPVSRRETLAASASAMIALAGCGGRSRGAPTSTTQTTATTTTTKTTDEPSETTSASTSTTTTTQQTTKGYAGEPIIENVSGYVSGQGTVDRLNITISRPPKAKAFNLSQAFILWSGPECHETFTHSNSDIQSLSGDRFAIVGGHNISTQGVLLGGDSVAVLTINTSEFGCRHWCGNLCEGLRAGDSMDVGVSTRNGSQAFAEYVIPDSPQRNQTIPLREIHD